MLTEHYKKAFSLINIGDAQKTNITFCNYLGNSYALYGVKSLTQNHSLADLMKRVKTTMGVQGVAFGTGNVPPTTNDYFLSGDLISSITATCAISYAFDDTGYEISALYTITNTGTEDITIGEIAIFGSLWVDTSSTQQALYDRTTLDEPVTIPAGGVGQITYTIRTNYPT